MDDVKNLRIKQMRADGASYAKIAFVLGISENTVKSYCKRHDLGGRANGKNIDLEDCCRNCGRKLIQTPKHKKKKFCSAKCRIEWWNTHIYMVNKRAVYHYKCENCGVEFSAYGNAGRKFCCHECYIHFRFRGGKSNADETTV